MRKNDLKQKKEEVIKDLSNRSCPNASFLRGQLSIINQILVGGKK